MLLSRKTSTDLGGKLQMDLTYATIPTPNGSMFRLNRELERKYHVEILGIPQISLCIVNWRWDVMR
jgi:hypothetical protein